MISVQAKARDLAVQPFVTLNVPIPASQDSSLEECMASAVFEEKVGSSCWQGPQCQPS